MRSLRTPEQRFADLPDYPYQPHYATVADGLRMAYVDVGPPGGEPVLLLHGERTWSFLYRTVIPILADAGLRVIAPDLVGFGRSDKPADVTDHSYARHVEWLRAFAFDALDLHAVTVVGHDWGGLIGLRVATEYSDRIARIVATNTGLLTGDQPMPDVWTRESNSPSPSRGSPGHERRSGYRCDRGVGNRLIVTRKHAVRSQRARFPLACDTSIEPEGR